MSKITSYQTLVTAITEASEDESLEFSSFVPTMIGLAEDRLKREMDTDGLVATAIVTVSASTAEVAKPSDYKFAHNVFFYSNDNRVKTVVKESDDYLRMYWPHETSTVTAGPSYYTDKDSNTFIIAPCFVSSTPLHVKYEQNIPALTSTNSVNFLVEEVPDALYFACMAESARFRKAWSELEHWDGAYVNNVSSINNEGRRKRKDSSDQEYFNPENSLANDKEV